MKLLLIFALVGLPLLLLLVNGFVFWDLNPAHWPREARIFYAVTVFSYACLSLFILKDELSEEENKLKKANK